MAEFNNLINKASTFDTFSGTELKVYLKLVTKYDVYQQPVDYELIEMGNIASITATTVYDNQPILAVSYGRAKSIATGEAYASGNIVWNVLNESFLGNVKKAIEKAGLFNTGLTFDKKKVVLKKELIKYINELPFIDLVILGVKENDPEKKIQAEIKDIKLKTSRSQIGVTQIRTAEVYEFMARKIVPFKPVKNSDVKNPNEKNEEYFSF